MISKFIRHYFLLRLFFIRSFLFLSFIFVQGTFFSMFSHFEVFIHFTFIPFPHLLPNCCSFNIFKRINPYSTLIFLTNQCIRSKTLPLNIYGLQCCIECQRKSEEELLISKEAFTSKIYSWTFSLILISFDIEFALNFINFWSNKLLMSDIWAWRTILPMA